MKYTSMLLAAISALLFSSCASSGGVKTTGSTKPYTADTCIVTGNKLGSMGSPVTKVYGNQEVKFCCKPCMAKFDKEPQRYLSKLKG